MTVLDERTLAIPDRPGNNRLDSLSNILANPSVGLLFLIPGFEETLRVNGKARLSTDPALLEPMAVNGRAPTLAILVTVDEVFLHCAKALRRSRLWDPERRQDRREMPSLSKMVLDQTTGAPDDPGAMERIDADLEAEYRASPYRAPPAEESLKGPSEWGVALVSGPSSSTRRSRSPRRRV